MRIPITLTELESAVRASWSAETSHAPASWSGANPAAGQCWTTAYVVRHFLGGDIVLAEILPHTNPLQRHAWNRLPSGIEIDLTKDQLLPGQTLKECAVPESLIAAISGPQAALLLHRVQQFTGAGQRRDS